MPERRSIGDRSKGEVAVSHLVTSATNSQSTGPRLTAPLASRTDRIADDERIETTLSHSVGPPVPIIMLTRWIVHKSAIL